MIYPSGWWERHPLICRCIHLDRLGDLLGNCESIFANDTFLIENVTNLRIDYIHGVNRSRLKFTGQLGSMDYSDDHHGSLRMADIIAVKSFRNMRPLAQYFLNHTRPKLHALRVNSLILKFLLLSAIKCLCRVSATMNGLFRESQQMTDAALARRMSRGVHLTQSGWQWQQFVDPTSQDKWCWRMADDEWFIVASGQPIGYGPAGTWRRYRDPTSGRCFWWRSDDDWGWEQA